MCGFVGFMDMLNQEEKKSAPKRSRRPNRGAAKGARKANKSKEA